MMMFGQGVMSTTGSPLTLPTTNLLAAWDARVGVTDVSGACSAWADQSGNGKHATQGTAGNRPAISTADGYASLLFDGTNDALLTPLITASSGVKTIYSVVKQTSVPASYKTIFSPITQLFGVIPSTGKWGMYDSGNRDSGITSTTSRTRVAYEQQHSVAEARTWVNGSAGTTHAWLGTGNIGAGSIGAYNGGTSHYFAGHIMFIAMYGAAHSTDVEAYLTQEWGV